MVQRRILSQLMDERAYQEAKHPLDKDGFPEDIRLGILIEEVGEVGKAICERKPAQARHELIEVAATALRWVEYMDREAIESMNNMLSLGISPTEAEQEMFEIAMGRGPEWRRFNDSDC